MILAVVIVGPSATADDIDDIRAELARRFAAAPHSVAVRGVDDWFFHGRELHGYSVGPFWGNAAIAIYPGASACDPLTSIVSCHRELSNAGIALILVAVPGKLSIGASALDTRLACAERIDVDHQVFYRLLEDQGVTVIDLVPDFAALWARGIAPFCRQDSHWSPAGMAVACERIAERVVGHPWHAARRKQAATSRSLEIEVSGDLAALARADVPKERLHIEQWFLDGQGITTDRQSPVVLLGDSHTLVFSNGLLADHAGLPDHLAAKLGYAVDNVGNQANGANQSRIALARRRDKLAGKRCLVWVLSVRNFTASSDGWKIVPLTR